MSGSIRKLIDQVKKVTSPLQIVLFGSHAHGKPTSNSDIDLAIIIKNSNKNFHDRVIDLRKNIRSTTPIDFFIFTKKETESLKKTNPFVEEIFTKGKTVYAQ